MPGEAKVDTYLISVEAFEFKINDCFSRKTKLKGIYNQFRSKSARTYVLTLYTEAFIFQTDIFLHVTDTLSLEVAEQCSYIFLHPVTQQ